MKCDITSAMISGLSHISTWRRMGLRACRCRESFWLSETVSKQRIAPEAETDQGRTFWLDTLEMTSSFDAALASL